MPIAPSVKRLLDEQKAAYDCIAHPLSHSSHETAQAAHVPDDHIAKAVVLKDAKGHVLVVIPGDCWVNLHLVAQELNRDLQLARETEIEPLFADCKPGAIPPFGRAYGIETLLDESLTSLARIHFEAGDHQQLVRMEMDAFQRLMKGVRHGHFCQAD